MKIHVVYTTQLKAALGMAEETLDVDPPCTLRRLVDVLAQRHPEHAEGLLVDGEGNLLPSVLLCVGDAQRRPDDGPELSDGETVTLLSAISGG